MTKRVKRVAVLGMLALVAAVVSPATRAVANHNATLRVQVSNPILVGDNCDPGTGKGCRFGESMRFLAPTLNVHRGDEISFDFAGFHTASLLPVGQDALVFRGANRGIDKPFSVFQSDPDDTTAEGATADKPALKVNPAVAAPSIGGAPVDCGAADNPCVYDGTKVVNSGLPLGPPPVTFTVTIDTAAGNSFWVMCFLHTHMFLRVNVVADTAAATTQEQIDSAAAQQIAFDQEWAEQTDARLLTKRSSHVTASGKRVYDVKAGIDSHWANLNAFYPRKLSVPKGATVRYHFSELIYEDHTATVPAPAAFSLYDQFFAPMCDPDTDTGAGPDTPDPGTGPPCGGDLSKFETDMSSPVFWGTGNGVLSGASDIENSGFRGAQFDNNPWDLKYRARSGKKGWRVFCLIHGAGMSQRVVVKPTT